MNMDDVKALACVIVLCALAWFVHDVLPARYPADYLRIEQGGR